MPGANSTLYVDVGGTFTRLIQKNRGRFKTLAQFKSQPSDLCPRIQTWVRRKKMAPGGIVVGMRGVWTPAKKLVWKKKLKSLGPQVTVTSDVELAHLLAFEDRPGLVLIAGTGSIALGRSPSGRWARAGGKGPLIGDEGSGYWIGKEHLFRTKGKMFSKAQLKRRARNPIFVSTVAGLAKKILLSKSKDAEGLQNEAIGHLQRLIQSVQQRLKWKGRIPLYLRGGLWENPTFRKKFARQLPKEFTVVKP